MFNGQSFGRGSVSFELEFFSVGGIANMVGCNVVGDSIEPSRKLCSRHVGFSGFVDAKENILCKILSLLGSRYPASHKSNDLGLVAINQFLKGDSIVLFDSQHQAHVGVDGSAELVRNGFAQRPVLCCSRWGLKPSGPPFVSRNFLTSQT